MKPERQIINKINWNEQFKIRLASAEESMDKHDLIKLLVVRKLIRKNKNQKFWIRIYTEFHLENSHIIPDIYFENIRTKEIICYEIQKDLFKDYIKRREEEYQNVEIYPFQNLDLIIIPIKKSPDNLSELNKWLDQFII